MPIATKFAALERGNGFPFCPARVDVDDYDYWTTLGGTQKGGVLSGAGFEDQKALSLVNAMKLFWNGYGMNADTSDGTNIKTDVTYDDNDETSLTSDDLRDRVCIANYSMSKNPSMEEEWMSGISLNIGVVRLYFADAFVGYGLSGGGEARSDPDTFVLFGSYTNDDITGVAANSILQVSIQYITISGIHVVGQAITYIDGLLVDIPNSGTYSGSVSVVNDNIAASLSFQIADENPVNIDVSITGLQFYTYP